VWNSSASQPMHRYTPAGFPGGCSYGLVLGASVPDRRSTR